MAVEKPPNGIALALLFWVTAGVWAMAFSHRVSRLLQRSHSPWPWTIGSVVPIANLFVIHNIAANAKHWAVEADRLGPNPRNYVLGMMLSNSFGYVLTKTSPVLSLVGIVIQSIPWLVLNRAIWQSVKAYDVDLVRSPIRPGYAIPLLAGMSYVALVLFGLMPEVARLRGTAVASGSRVRGASMLYSLEAPSNGWVRVAPGTLMTGSKGDLELLGPEPNEQVSVYVYDDREQTLDGRVDVRRSMMKDEVGSGLQVREERFFLPEADMVMASAARYAGGLPRQVAWVMTTSVGHRYVEVVALGPSKTEDDVERVARSLRLTEAP